jgi:hypothetical protein
VLNAAHSINSGSGLNFDHITTSQNIGLIASIGLYSRAGTCFRAAACNQADAMRQPRRRRSWSRTSPVNNANWGDQNQPRASHAARLIPAEDDDLGRLILSIISTILKELFTSDQYYFF